MIIQQAVYGVSTGHALLRWSDEALQKEFNNAAWLTDLPATCPIGVTWAPFFRMVLLEGWMFFVHTQPDPGAARGGMVFSRAALIPIADVTSLNDLSGIAEELKKPLAPNDPLPPITVTQHSKSAVQPQVEELATAIAQGLTQNVTRPAVVFQQDFLNDALLELWRRAPPEFRTKLTFGLSFSPEDVHQLAIAITPIELAPRWEPAQIVIQQGESCVDANVATILDLQNSSSVRKFASLVALPLDSVKAIAIAVQAEELWRTERTSVGDVQLLRILAERALPGMVASNAKTLVRNRLASAWMSWEPVVVLSMRNLDIASLDEGGRLAGAIQSWVTDRSLHPPHVGLEEILAAWISDKPSQVWKDAVERGVCSALTDDNVPSSLFGLIWRATVGEPARSQRALSLLKDPQQEKYLLASIEDSLSQKEADEVLPAAVSKGWWLVAGSLLARSRSTRDSLAAAISTAPATRNARKVLIASSLSKASPDELVNAAIESHDAFVMQMAAQVCVKEPSVLRGFDWKRYEWFELFNAAYKVSPEVIEALPDRRVGMGQMIGAQMAAKAIWQVVVETPLADLADVPNRQRAWDLVPEDLIMRILDITAHSWLRQFERSTQSIEALEPRLAAVVSEIARRPSYFMDVLRRDPSSLPLYLENFPFEVEKEAIEFISELADSNLLLAEDSSKFMGQALVAHGWRSAAQSAVSWLQRRRDFYPMYRECYPLLGFVDQLWVTMLVGLASPLTGDQAWEAFATEASHLYPSGPWHNHIWSRSGGNEEDLRYDGSGKATWHYCMRELRNGMHPGAAALIDEMMSDFPHNNALRQLKQQRFWR